MSTPCAKAFVAAVARLIRARHRLRQLAHGLAAEPSPETFASWLSGALGEWVEEADQRVLDDFRRRDALTGREIGWEGAGIAPGTGVAAGIDERGNLLVDTPGERLALGSGEVTLTLEPGR